MSCEKGTCEHNAYQITLRKLKAENQALRDELEAVKARLSDVASYNLKQGMLLEVNGFKPEEIASKNIRKIKADAIREMLMCVLRISDGFSHDLIGRIKEHANQVEKGQ